MDPETPCLQESEIHRPSEAAHEWLESYLGNASEKTDACSLELQVSCEHHYQHYH